MRARGATEVLKELNKARTELNATTNPLDQKAYELRKGFCTLVEDVLFKDLDFALSRKVEQELWNVGFRSAITKIQKDTSTERAVRLSVMIDISTGYFLQLLQKLVHRYRVTELKAIPGPDCLGVLDPRDDSNASEEAVRITKRSRVLYICQYCLVHLGDLARYRNDMALADSYYWRAVDIDPRNGHPYNQVGLLEGLKGSRLSTVFYYVRSLSVINPFVVAITNLEKIYILVIQEETPTPKERMNATETVDAFLHFISLVHMNQQLSLAREILPKLMESLLRLLTSKKIDEEKLLMMTTIALYTFDRSNKNLGSVASESSVDNGAKMMTEFVFELFRGALLASLQPGNQDSLPSSPTILVLLEALIAGFKNVSVNPFKDLWFILAAALNSFKNNQSAVEWNNEALPEDFKLRGFVVLRHIHSKLDFTENDKIRSQADALRRSRLVKQGKELCKVKFVDGSNILRFEDNEFHAQSSIKSANLEHELERLRIDSDESRPVVRFNVENQDTGGARDKPKRQNVALQAIMQQHERKPFLLPSPDIPFASPFNQPPPHLGGQRWSYNPTIAPPPPPPPPPAAIIHPAGSYPMTIEELVRQPPPPIYNVDLRVVHPPRAPPPSIRPLPGPRAPIAYPAQSIPIRQPNTYSLFSNSTWNPQMPMAAPHSMGAQQTMGGPPMMNMIPSARPQGGSLWKPEKPTQATSALERLLKERKAKEP